jgi:hypothetical protein
MSTLISNLYNLYKLQTTGKDEDAKEFSKHLPVDQAKELRIDSNFMFQVVSFFARRYINKQKPNVGNPMPTNLYNEHMVLLGDKEYLDLAYETIINIRDNWNVLTAVDKEDTHNIFIAIDKHTPLSTRYTDQRYGDLEDSLQWQCYLIAGIHRLLPLFDSERRSVLTNIKSNLMAGVYRCFTEDGNILRHPLKTVEYDLEPISTDMISGLVLLYAVTEDEHLKELIDSTFTKSDYMIPGTTIDLCPSLIWNPIRAMSYAGIRIIQGKLTKDDKQKVLDMMSIMPYDNKPANQRSIYGALTATTLAEALALLDEDFSIPAIKFTQYQYDSSLEMNPEWAGSLAVMYHRIGYKTLMENMTDVTLRWASQYRGLIRKQNESLDGYDGSYPLPLKYRTSNDYYWQRSAYSTWVDTSRDHPNLDLITILGKSLPFVFYPV